MSNMPGASQESLILRERAELAAQPFLFSEDDIAKVEKPKQKFNGTGERLFRDDRERYGLVVRMLAEPGVSIRMIVEQCHVSDHTIRSIAAREKIPIAAQKEAVLADLGHVQRLCVDRMIDLIPEAPLKDVTLCFGITTDKRQLLSGDATMRVEQTERVDIFTSFPDFVRELEARPVAGDNNPETHSANGLTIHLASENNLQKALMNGDDHEQPANQEGRPKL